MGPLQCLPLHRASVSPAHTHSSSFLLTLCGLLPSCFPQSPTNLTQPALTLHQHGTEMLSTPRIRGCGGHSSSTATICPICTPPQRKQAYVAGVGGLCADSEPSTSTAPRCSPQSGVRMEV